MRKTTFLLISLCSLWVQAQNEWSTTAGSIRFEASVPLFEEIKAVNNNVNCFVSFDTNEINCSLFIQQFKFKKELMQKHFNEHYLESDRYPKAQFIGKIEKLEYQLLTDQPQEYQLKGILKIHGKSKPLFCKITLRKKNEEIEIDTSFSINTEDFTIEIPPIVASKISKEVAITLHAIVRE
jgi:hypothetical protein